MFSLPGRLTSSPALQRPGAFLKHVNEFCTEFCDAIQTRVSNVYEGLNTNTQARQKQAAAAVFEARQRFKSKHLSIKDTRYK